MDDVAMEIASQYVQSVLDVNVVEDGTSSVLALSLLRVLAANASQEVTRALRD